MRGNKRRRKLPDYIVIGQVTKPHGVRGALRIEPMTNDPMRFRRLHSVSLSFDDDERTAFDIAGVEVANQYVILSLKDLEDRDEAEKWRRAYVEIPRSECLPLPEGEYYYFELIDLLVMTSEGTEIGWLEDVLVLPAHDVYVVRAGEKEFLIPAVPEVIEKIDLDAGTMTIRPIPGLLDEF